MKYHKINHFQNYYIREMVDEKKTVLFCTSRLKIMHMHSDQKRKSPVSRCACSSSLVQVSSSLLLCNTTRVTSLYITCITIYTCITCPHLLVCLHQPPPGLGLPLDPLLQQPHLLPLPLATPQRVQLVTTLLPDIPITIW